MMYFAGGGMVEGHPLDMSIPWRVIPRTRIPIFGVNFRKCVTSATAFPGALQDAISAFVFLLERGHRAENISIVGDSGGGGISITFLLYLIKRELPVLECAVLVSPFVDLWTKFDGKGEGGEEEKKDMMLDFMNNEMFGTVGFQYTENRPELRGTLLNPSRGRLPEGYGYGGFCRSMIVYGDAEAFSLGKLFDHFQFVLHCESVQQTHTTLLFQSSFYSCREYNELMKSYRHTKIRPTFAKGS